MSTRRPEIEGLRAVAVALVLLYHLHLVGVDGGYVGVDVFFVVSGFLITGLLIRELGSAGRIDLAEFWARRVRRIMPMAIVVATITVIVGYQLLEPGRRDELMPVALGSVGFSANIVLYFRTGDYLAGVKLPSPLQHFWSLGVEEQFYLVWPVAAWAVGRYARRFWRPVLLVLCLAGCGASLYSSIMVTPHHRSAAYFLPQSRVWELLVGAALSIAALRLPRIVAGAAGWVGIAAVVWAAVTFNEETAFPGHRALVPVLGTVGVLLAGSVRWGPHLVLQRRPLQALGRWSYSIYLLHFPLITFAEARWGVLGVVEQLGVAAATVALSAATFRLIESPIRWSRYLSGRPRRSLLAGAVALSLLLSAGIAVSIVRVPSTTAAPQYAVPQGLDGLPASSPDDADDPKVTPVPAAGGPTSAPSASTTSTVPDPVPIRALLLGDSTLAELRWFEQGQLSLAGFSYLLDAEACRRLAYAGCEGREYRTPVSAAEVLKRPSEPVDVIVLEAGYHGKTHTFRNELGEFAKARQRSGARLVILTLKETLSFPELGSDGTRSVYTGFNEVIREMARSGALGDVTIADWNLFSYSHPEWFRPDGIHTNITGTLALGWFISMTLAAMYDNPCPFDNTYPCVVPLVADKDMRPLEMFGVWYTDQHCYEDGLGRRRVCEIDRRMNATN